MTYHQSASLGAAPKWCPPSSFLRDHPEADPCAITYKVNIPILGESEVSIPINQIINDIRLQLNQEMPGIIDNVWTQAQPKINELVHDIEQEVMRYAPDVARQVVREVVLPVVYQELERAMAEADLVATRATRTVVAACVGLAATVAGAAWWVTSRGVKSR